MRKPTAIMALAAIAVVTLSVFFLSRKPTGLNVILISVDTMRPDHLGCYGYRMIRTPNMDLLSREGITFTDALTSTPLTLPAHASMLTGLYPVSHGIRDNGSFVLLPDFTTLGEVLGTNGYATGAFIGASVLASRYGLDQGFDTYDDDLKGGRRGSAFEYPERTASLVSRSAVEWLGEVREPFFAFIHYFDPHIPYEPPPHYMQSYPTRPYDGEIAYADDEIGKVLEFLKKRDLLERTVIVLTSDHGEGLGEHSEATHGLLVYETTLRVPLILRLPSDCPLAERIDVSQEIGATARLIDIFPTVLDIIDIGFAGTTDGRSLVPLIEGDTLPLEPCYFESFYPYLAYRWSPLRGVRLDTWKFILAPTEELYDVGLDPKETMNLATLKEDKRDELSNALADFITHDSERKVPSRSRVTPRETQKLRALGYVSPTSTPLPTGEELTGKDPKTMIRHFDRLLIPGQEAFSRGEFDMALDKYSRFAEVDPTNPEAHLHRAEALIALNRLEEAEEACLAVMMIDSTNHTAYQHLGLITWMRGSLEEALAHYEHSLLLAPDSPEALASAGGILVNMGRADSAVTLLQKAIEIDPLNAGAIMNLGLAYSAQDMNHEALNQFRRLLAIDSVNLRALTKCAVLFGALGEVDSSIAYLERAESVAPGNPEILVHLGDAYSEKGSVMKAGLAYERALRREPENVPALLGLARVRASEGRSEESARILERIREIDPSVLDLSPQGGE
jgi:arylsulfatase A-like enzyme/tetratricopeptide (TPR) repeat protein